MQGRRVVVTGMGIISPLGLNVSDTWGNVKQGKSGVGVIQDFNVSELGTKISARVKNFDPIQYFDAKELRKIDPFIQFGMAAAIEAMTDANLTIDAERGSRAGVAIGSGIGGLLGIEKAYTVLLEQGPKKLSPFFIPSIIINMLPGRVSMRYGLKGPNISVVSACTTGAHNIGYAARAVAYGDADIMLAGGAEKASSALGVAGFSALRALSKRNDEPTKASRPWDSDRDGFVLGDGAGVLVLEEYEFAKKRGAKIYAELLGFGQSADAFHITLPDQTGTGAANAMRNAITDAKLQPEEVDYINAHATSTLAGDELEVLAIKTVFGEHAYALAVSSTKSMTGHLLGAAGAVEAIFSVLAIRDQVAPPTINLDNPTANCDLNFVPHVAQSRKIKVALSNSFGFGGTNASLVFKQYE